MEYQLIKQYETRKLMTGTEYNLKRLRMLFCNLILFDFPEMNLSINTITILVVYISWR